MVHVPSGVRRQEHGIALNNDVATRRRSPPPHYHLHHQFIIIVLQPQRTCHRHCMRVRA